MFADDLLAHKSFDANVLDTEVFRQLQECQCILHRWGRANQVCFDPGKEEFKILHRQNNVGEPFKYLGVRFDTRLIMEEAIGRITAEVGWRQQSLLRTRCFHTHQELLVLYKSFILSYAEYDTPAIYHPTPFHLWKLDQTQLQFLDELGLSLKSAMLDHNLAPLSTRRDIAMLGLFHKTVLGVAPQQFSRFIRPAQRAHFPRDLRGGSCRHNKQLHDPITGSETGALRRSFLGLVYTYNCLPQSVVDSPSTSIFQRLLQRAVRKAASASPTNNWSRLFVDGCKSTSVSTFQSWFDA